MIRNVHPIIAAIAMLWITTAANGGEVLNLSDFSSDETPAVILDAFLEFSILDNVLTVSVTNATQDPAPFDINAFYFNATSNLNSLVYTQNVAGWTLLQNQKADGFGQYDFGLIGNQGSNNEEVISGASIDFEFIIDSVEPMNELDFVTQLSTTPPGNNPMIAVAKFVHGPQDDSAFGAVVPEPATWILLSVCVIAILVRHTGWRLKTEIDV